MSDDPIKTMLEARVVTAARRWYASTNEAALADAVSELEIYLKRLARLPEPEVEDEP